jgi:hypothetical protein
LLVLALFCYLHPADLGIAYMQMSDNLKLFMFSGKESSASPLSKHVQSNTSLDIVSVGMKVNLTTV